MAFFNNLLWEKYPVDEIFRVYLSRKGLLLFNTFKIEHENRDFRKSLYFYIVDAGKKKEKTELRLGAGIILNQELTNSRHWGKMDCGRLPAP